MNMARLPLDTQTFCEYLWEKILQHYVHYKMENPVLNPVRIYMPNLCGGKENVSAVLRRKFQ